MVKSDPKKLAALLAALRESGDGESAEGSCIDAAKFLDGNEDESSIGCNLDKHPGMSAFREVIARVAGRADVSAVQVCISEDMGDEDFPFTDVVLVCTSASEAQLTKEFAKLTPDEVFETDGRLTKRLPKPQAGQRWLSVWWD